MTQTHTGKKISTVTSQENTRHGMRQVHKQHVKEHEDEILNDYDEANDLDADAVEGDQDVEGSITEPSQNASQIPTLPKLLIDMQADQRKRTEVRKQAVHKAYKEAHAATQKAITSQFDEHEARACKAHDAQMARLKELLKMKTQIEAAMTEKLVELRNDYIYHCKTIEKVVEHRMRQLN